MKRGLKRGLLKGLTAIVIGLSSTYQPIYAQETRIERRQEYITITVNRKKYHITKDKRILDEKESRVTNQNTLKQVIQTYILSKELPKYKQTAQNNLKNFNRTKLLTQLKELKKAYLTVLKTPLENILNNLNSSSPLSRKFNIGKNLLEGTIKALTNIHLNPKMYLYAEITSELKRAEQDYKKFIRLADTTDLKDYRNAINLHNLLLRSEPIIKAATYSFNEIKDSRNYQLKINQREAKEFNQLLRQKDTEEIKRKRQMICNKIKARAKRTKEAKNYKNKKQQERSKLEQKFLKNISIKFHSNR